MKRRTAKAALMLAALLTALSFSSCTDAQENALPTQDELLALAEENELALYTHDDLSYNIIEGGTPCISIAGITNEYRADYYIPSQIDGLTVRVIAENAFSYGSFTSVSLPASLNEISRAAFYDCSALKEIKIPSGTKKIGSYAFYHCVMLEEITIPDSVTEIGGLAFASTPWLENLTDEFVIVGDGILIDYNGSGTDVTIPDGVKSISSAFCNNTAIESVTFPDSLTYIGEAAFMGCTSLRQAELPPHLERIGDSAFRGCTSLKLELPDNVETGYMSLEQ